MSVILYVGFVVFGLFGLVAFGTANTAIHEGVASIMLLASVACLIGAGVCTRLDAIRKAIERTSTATEK